MDKQKMINHFAKHIIVEEQRKNKVTRKAITTTLVKAALDLAFVNESCKSSGSVSKSQVIYRKIGENTEEDVKSCFQEATLKFLKCLKIFSRNRKFLLSFDTTDEAFYGKFSKAEDPLYLHAGSIAKGSEFYYKYLTVAITCEGMLNYIIDGIIVPVGAYVEDYVFSMLEFAKKHIIIDVVLFDRGFNSWALIDKLNQLKVSYIIFWKKQGEWHQERFERMKDGEFERIFRKEKYYRFKHDYEAKSYFVLVKQLEYEGKKYDWIFATNLKLKSAASYVKRYKKRWAIETIYRVTDDIRVYTTSTNALTRYFLFMFTCFVYNIWKFFQRFLGENFTLANFKTNMTMFMIKTSIIHPVHYNSFEYVAKKFF
jgi:hypothetical protein